MSRKHGDIIAQNPLRLLKRGFSTYSDEDRRHLASEGKEGKRDIERDRRLDADAEVRILEVLNDRPNERAFFVLALESAMRMRGCYTLDTTQISLAKRTIHFDRTKNGDNRQVPLTTPALQNVRGYTQLVIHKSSTLQPGTRVPACCTAKGRVLLASLPRDQAELFLERAQSEQMTEYTIVDQELELGRRTIAVPLKNFRGETVAAMNISVHAGRIANCAWRHAGALPAGAAQELPGCQFHAPTSRQVRRSLAGDTAEVDIETCPVVPSKFLLKEQCSDMWNNCKISHLRGNLGRLVSTM